MPDDIIPTMEMVKQVKSGNEVFEGYHKLATSPF